MVAHAIPVISEEYDSGVFHQPLFRRFVDDPRGVVVKLLRDVRAPYFLVDMAEFPGTITRIPLPDFGVPELKFPLVMSRIVVSVSTNVEHLLQTIGGKPDGFRTFAIP
jgi:hypothetical protein